MIIQLFACNAIRLVTGVKNTTLTATQWLKRPSRRWTDLPLLRAATLALMAGKRGLSVGHSDQQRCISITTLSGTSLQAFWPPAGTSGTAGRRGGFSPFLMRLRISVDSHWFHFQILPVRLKIFVDSVIGFTFRYCWLD